jgi:hypothetical protein
MVEARLVERLRVFLQDLKPEARNLLIAELERSLLRGDETPGAELVLQELRRSMRESSRPAPRGGSLSRLFFQPLEPFLVDDSPAQQYPGRVSRLTLDPIWQWISRDLVPGEAKAVSENVARAYAADDSEEAERLARVFQGRVLIRLKETLAAIGDDEKLRRKLIAQIATPHAIADITAIRDVIGARETLLSLSRRLQGHIANLSDTQLDLVKAVLDNVKFTDSSVFAYALVLIMSRLAAPWQLIRLATRDARSDQAARIAETRYAPAVAIVLGEMQRAVNELRSELKSGQGVATGAQLKAIHDAARGLHTEVDLSESEWGRQLAGLRTEISELLKGEIEAMPGRARRLLRPRPDKDIASGIKIDGGEVREIEAAIEFVGTCRSYAAELAVSEVTQRAYSDLQHYLETTTQTLIDGLRNASDSTRQFRRAQCDAAIAFCSKVFGADYAAVLSKAADVAMNGERKVARA